jgi:hypothetical protein
MPRYAVLLDLHDPELQPMALVTEHGDSVRVHFAIECGLKDEYREPYTVMEPDGTSVRYEPGNDAYFDSVLTTLSRGFVVDKLEVVDELDASRIAGLFMSKVVLPRTVRRTSYAGSVVAERSRVTAYGETAHEPEVETAAVAASDSMLATAA